MKLEQIAFYAHNEEQVETIKDQFGLLTGKWIEDIVEGDVEIHGLEGVHNSKAHLRFNYELGVELEILTYLEGPHWHMTRPEFLRGEIFQSHLGIKMQPSDLVGGSTTHPILMQKMMTRTHSNPVLKAEKRTYEYQIYDLTRGTSNRHLGTDLKYIWRVGGEYEHS
jgi:hypothetical protein